LTYALDIRSAALQDLDEAAGWYDERSPGLGAEFARCVMKALDKLQSNPLAHRLRDRSRGVRWCFPRRFPHRICYCVTGKRITVFALIHAARRDREWKKRL